MADAAVVDLPVEPDRQVNRRRPYTHDECVGLARVWEDATGAMPTQSDWDPTNRRRNIRNMLVRIRQHRDTIERYETGGYPSAVTVRGLFGSWNAFVAACGRAPRAPGRPAIYTGQRPETPTTEQVRRRVGERDAVLTTPRAYGRQVLARTVRAILEAEAAHDVESLKAILLDGAAELLAWADRLGGEQ